MKLTKSDREAFVNAVMDDVPKIDYKDQAQKLFDAWVVDKLPPEIAPLYKNPTLRACLKEVYFPRAVNVLSCWQHCGCEVNFDEDLLAPLRELDEKDVEQDRERAKLRAQVSATINGCTTLKQARERLPEFTKYLPADRDGTGVINLPVVANLVAALTSAGWPKGELHAAR